LGITIPPFLSIFWFQQTVGSLTKKLSLLLANKYNYCHSFKVAFALVPEAHTIAPSPPDFPLLRQRHIIIGHHMSELAFAHDGIWLYEQIAPDDAMT